MDEGEGVALFIHELLRRGTLTPETVSQILAGIRHKEILQPEPVTVKWSLALAIATDLTSQ